MYGVLNNQSLYCLYVLYQNKPNTLPDVYSLLVDAEPSLVIKLIKFLNRLELCSGLNLTQNGIDLIECLGYDTRTYPLTLEYNDGPVFRSEKTIWKDTIKKITV